MILDLKEKMKEDHDVMFKDMERLREDNDQLSKDLVVSETARNKLILENQKLLQDLAAARGENDSLSSQVAGAAMEMLALRRKDGADAVSSRLARQALRDEKGRQGSAREARAKRKQAMHRSATRLQAKWKGRVAQRKYEQKKMNRHSAATKLQRLRRGSVVRRQYQKDLAAAKNLAEKQKLEKAYMSEMSDISGGHGKRLIRKLEHNELDHAATMVQRGFRRNKLKEGGFYMGSEVCEVDGEKYDLTGDEGVKQMATILAKTLADDANVMTGEMAKAARENNEKFVEYVEVKEEEAKEIVFNTHLSSLEHDLRREVLRIHRGKGEATPPVGSFESKEEDKLWEKQMIKKMSKKDAVHQAAELLRDRKSVV